MGFFDKLFGKNKPEKKQEKSLPVHKQEWDNYFTNVDNIIVSIMLDLGLKSVAPIEDLPLLVWISIKMNNPREDGLSSNEESNILYEVEDTLVDKLVAKYNCLYTGRLTSNNHRDLYFYFDESNGLDKAIADIMSAYPDYKYNFGTKDDKDWGVYLDFLYPTPAQHQCMMNRRVLFNLEKNGDNHEMPREVDHFLYFETENGRSSFVAEYAVDKGFFVKQTDTKEDGDQRYMLHLTRTDKVDYNSINDCTIELSEKALEFDGYYDGWGCVIVK